VSETDIGCHPSWSVRTGGQGFSLKTPQLNFWQNPEEIDVPKEHNPGDNSPEGVGCNDGRLGNRQIRAQMLQAGDTEVCG
jgi:hypothetical protein